MDYFANETTTSTISPPTPTTTQSPKIHDDTKYLVVPIIVIILIMFLSALVYLMAQRRKMDLMRQNILSLYEFDSNEQEWDSLSSYDNPGYSTFDKNQQFTTSV